MHYFGFGFSSQGGLSSKDGSGKTSQKTSRDAPIPVSKPANADPFASNHPKPFRLGFASKSWSFANADSSNASMSSLLGGGMSTGTMMVQDAAVITKLDYKLVHLLLLHALRYSIQRVVNLALRNVDENRYDDAKTNADGDNANPHLVRDSKMLDLDMAQVRDFFEILSICLWHGLKPDGRPERERNFWDAVESLAKINPPAYEASVMLAKLNSQCTTLHGLCRSWLCLILNQNACNVNVKGLHGRAISNHSPYEEWAFLRQEQNEEMFEMLDVLSGIGFSLNMSPSRLDEDAPTMSGPSLQASTADLHILIESCLEAMRPEPGLVRKSKSLLVSGAGVWEADGRYVCMQIDESGCPVYVNKMTGFRIACSKSDPMWSIRDCNDRVLYEVERTNLNQPPRIGWTQATQDDQHQQPPTLTRMRYASGLNVALNASLQNPVDKARLARDESNALTIDLRVLRHSRQHLEAARTRIIASPTTAESDVNFVAATRTDSSCSDPDDKEKRVMERRGRKKSKHKVRVVRILENGKASGMDAERSRRQRRRSSSDGSSSTWKIGHEIIDQSQHERRDILKLVEQENMAGLGEEGELPSTIPDDRENVPNSDGESKVSHPEAIVEQQSDTQGLDLDSESRNVDFGSKIEAENISKGTDMIQTVEIRRENQGEMHGLRDSSLVLHRKLDPITENLIRSYASMEDIFSLQARMVASAIEKRTGGYVVGPLVDYDHQSQGVERTHSANEETPWTQRSETTEEKCYAEVLQASVTGHRICNKPGNTHVRYFITCQCSKGNNKSSMKMNDNSILDGTTVSSKVIDDQVERIVVHRRYQEFKELHMKLTDRFPDLALPGLPKTGFRRRFGDDYIEKKERSLDQYINELLSIRPNPSWSDITLAQYPTVVEFLTSITNEEDTQFWEDESTKNDEQYIQETNPDDQPLNDEESPGLHISLILDTRPDTKALERNGTNGVIPCVACGSKIMSGMWIGRGKLKAKFCHYTEKWFCPSCFDGGSSTSAQRMIPSKLVHEWKADAFPVCASAAEYLDMITTHPLVCLSSVNPHIYEEQPIMAMCRKYRLQLVMGRDHLSCKRSVQSIIPELKYNQVDAYLLQDSEIYSISDLKRAHDGHLSLLLESWVKAIAEHVETCSLCSASGFVCEFCQDKTPIYPFQVDTVVQCRGCQAFFHRMCFVDGEDSCPQCKRRKALTGMAS